MISGESRQGQRGQWFPPALGQKREIEKRGKKEEEKKKKRKRERRNKGIRRG